MNNLASLLPDTNINCLYADDVSILAVKRTLAEAEEAAQEAVDIVVKWATEWRLKLNATKSEVCAFSHASCDSQLSPRIIIDGTPIKVNPYPRFLGVKLDRSLTFGPHVKDISEAATNKLKMLSCLTHSKWGWKKQHVTRVYKSHVKSFMDYSGFAWQTFLSTENLGKLERIQNRALSIASGQYKTAPSEAKRAECSIVSYATSSKRAIAKAREKAVRLPTDHPRHIAIQPAVKKRLTKKSDWRSTSADIIDTHLPLSCISTPQPFELFTIPPWSNTLGATINERVSGISSKNDPVELLLSSSIRQIDSIGTAITIYTDGSADAGTSNGGAAVVVTTGTAAAPDTINTIRIKGAKHTCSYDEEKTAMKEAITWIKNNCEDQEVCIVTDSQSLCLALQNRNPEVNPLRALLSSCSATITIQWVPGHAGIPGNEEADRAAKEAAQMQGPHKPTTYKCACSLIDRHITDTNTHARTTAVYSGFSKTKELEIKTRSDQVFLAQLRSGHQKSFREYVHDKLDPSVDPVCPLCEKERHNLEHWLQCEGTLAARQRLFGNTECGLETLCREPAKTLALSRSTLRGARVPQG